MGIGIVGVGIVVRHHRRLLQSIKLLWPVELLRSIKRLWSVELLCSIRRLRPIKRLRHLHRGLNENHVGGLRQIGGLSAQCRAGRGVLDGPTGTEDLSLKGERGEGRDQEKNMPLHGCKTSNRHRAGNEKICVRTMFSGRYF